jgi:DEAD/DEAH box helicase domain-containing protein
MIRVSRRTSDVDRPLAVDDIVHIKALIPESINFSYVDQAKLDILLQTSASSQIVQNGSHDLTPRSEPTNALGPVANVLYFEFTDGELRPKPTRVKG